MGSSSVDENCDMQFIDIREQIKYLKFGYGRATDQLNIEIRAGNYLETKLWKQRYYWMGKCLKKTVANSVSI